MSASSYSERSSFAAASTGILGGLAKTVLSANHWHHVFMASVVPFLVSALWYSSRTVIEVTDDEQSVWIQMWLRASEQKRAIQRARRLVLLSPWSKTGKRVRSNWQRRRIQQATSDEDKEEEGGRFAPPKFEFLPAKGVNTWAWFGFWPVSVSSLTAGANGPSDFFMGPYGPGPSSNTGYSITVWFASPAYGTAIARDLLLKGRKLWLAERAKKTEIWMHQRRCMPLHFDITTRPSRPLSSVIVEGNTKENLLLDTRRFLGAEKWYVEKGIPYRRGYLLYGPPGCGKTSLIYALAGDLRLPIIVVPLNDNNMDDQLLMEVFSQAPKDSIILIEDVDCALPRKTGGQPAEARMNRMAPMPVTLSGLLNAIDGVGAQEGRLLFMTTNHIDRLDDALIRPGRVDVQCHLDKASKKAAAELFDQFFASSSIGQNFSFAILSESRSAFLAHVQDGAFSFAALQGVLMTARDDPLMVGDGMQKLLAMMDTDVPEKHSPWVIMSSFKNNTHEALKNQDKLDEEAEGRFGTLVVKQLTGSPTDATHNIDKRWITLQKFTTFGAPGMLTSSGVIYYEIEIIEKHGRTQFGFSNKGGLHLSNDGKTGGIGENDMSWALDGVRKLKWHDGEFGAFKCKWQEGTVVGLAANVDKGMIAISKDGAWDKDGQGEDECGVVFWDEKIKEGVFPSFSASGCKLQYSFDKEHLKHTLPPTSIWGLAKADGNRIVGSVHNE